LNHSHSTESRDDVFIAAAWLGLVTGLIEGGGLLLLQQRGWLAWPLAQLGVSAEIIWISAFFDLLVFTIAALLIWGMSRVMRRLPALSSSVLVLTVLMLVIWLIVVGRMRHSAVLVLAIGLATVFKRWFGKHVLQVTSFWRKTLPGLAAMSAIAFVAIQGASWLQERSAIASLPQAAPGTPNILVIVVDTLRADHLSAYGYSRATSPTLDRLAQDGTLFENAFAASSWTLPSHASLLTGRYPHEHGLERGGQVLDARYPTLPQALSARGYRTGAFSGNNFWFCRRNGFGRGFAHFEDYFESLTDMAFRTILGREFDEFVLRHMGIEDVPGRRSAADINRSALRWIDRDTTRPFFVFINYFDVHDPYLPPQPYRGKFSKFKNPGGIINSFVLRDYPKLTSAQLQSEVDAYDGGIAYVDDEIGRLMAALDKRGLHQSTLVIITSDHGESLGEHGLLGHRDALYRELIHVPLIFYWPGHVPAGIRVPTPVTNTDMATTVLDVLGMSKQQLFPGPSLTQLWNDPMKSTDWPLPLSELAQMPFELAKRNPAYSGWLKSLISARWHYILHQKLGPELYQWPTDPEELHNMVGTSAGKGIVQQFAGRLQEMLSHSASVAKAESEPRAGSGDGEKSARVNGPIRRAKDTMTLRSSRRYRKRERN
jgi:arylsulfatase A-like enzyme